MTAAPAAWMPDPSGRHELRYWDGDAWTHHVADHGETAEDPLAEDHPPPLPSAPAPAPAPARAYPGATRRSGRALASLVLGVVGIFIAPIICSTLAIVFGVLAGRDIDRDPALTGRGMAKAGLILGIVGLVFGLAFIVYLSVR